MGCGESLMRTIVIGCNVLFFLLGLGALGGGIWLAVSPGTMFDFLDAAPDAGADLVRNAAYVFIASGVLVALVALLGCCGAWMRNSCMLGLYAAFMVVVLAVEIAAIATIVVFDQKFRNEFQGKLQTALHDKYGTSGSDGEAFTKTVDAIQKEFECCGIVGPIDYTNGTDYSLILVGRPTSCLNNGLLINKGCYEAIKERIKQYLGLVIGITVAILVFEFLLFIFAILLCRKVGKNKMV